VGLVLLAFTLGRQEILLALAGIWLTMVIFALQAATRHRMQGAEATPTQFPAVYQALRQLSERFQSPPTRVFIVRKFSYEAESYGFSAPYVIMLPSVLLDALDQAGGELQYVLGRELGRIQFGHTRANILIGGEASSLPAPLGWIVPIRDLVFGWYRRTQALSGDRAGIVACRNVRAAIHTQIKVAVGSRQIGEVAPDALLDQAYQCSSGWDRFHATLIHLQCATPLLIPRLQAMVEWAGLPEREEEPEGSSPTRP
jgi:hypothetical protein